MNVFLGSDVRIGLANSMIDALQHDEDVLHLISHISDPMLRFEDFEKSLALKCLHQHYNSSLMQEPKTSIGPRRCLIHCTS